MYLKLSKNKRGLKHVHTWMASLLSVCMILSALLVLSSSAERTLVEGAGIELPVTYAPYLALTPTNKPSEILKLLNPVLQETSGAESGFLFFQVNIPECKNHDGCIVELRHSRSSQTQIWFVDHKLSEPTFTIVSPSAIHPASLGITIKIPFLNSSRSLVGYISPNTTKKITPFFWAEAEFESADLKFERSGGLLTGSVLFLALFSATLAILHKDYPFLLLSGWLIASLRLAAFNGGWDLTWFGVDLHRETYLLVARSTLAIYGFLSAALFYSLFRTQLTRTEVAVIRGLLLVFFSLLLISPFVTHNEFNFIFWPTAVASLFITLGISALQMSTYKSGTAILFFLAWTLVAAGAVADILFASGKLSVRFSVFNLQTGTMAAAFILAIALANRMQADRQSRIVAEELANAALRKYQQTYDTVPVGLFTLSPQGSLTHFNPKFAAMLDVEQNACLQWDVLIPSVPLSLFPRSEEGSFEFSTLKDGVQRWFEVQTLRQGEIIEGTIAEITERKLGEAQLIYAANFDQLTGLHNRHHMIQQLDLLLALSEGPNTQVGAMAMIDIQRFHQVVTYFGHATGDEVLCKVRDRIISAVPPTTMVGRLSADTFVLIFKNSSLVIARDCIQAVLDSIHNTAFISNDKSFNLRTRAGVIGLDTSMSSKDALTACDSAMQDAKARGGGCLVAYVDQDPAWISHKAETDLMTQFSVRIPFERMQMLYQPIVSLANPSQSMGYEALIRLQGADGRLVSPAHFIPALEKNGMMSQLDRWVVRTVFEFLEAHPLHFEALTYCAVNLSGASLNDERFLDEILALAAGHPQTVQKICFEITETVAIADIASTKRFIDNIKALGARIALDDFGAGYSSFGYLAQLGADFLKIDGNLVKGLKEGTSNFAIVKAIADLGQSLNMKVVAEWVEDAATLQALLKIGVNAGQGWGLGKPMAAHEMAACTDGSAFLKDNRIRQVLGLEVIVSVDVTPVVLA